MDFAKSRAKEDVTVIKNQIGVFALLVLGVACSSSSFASNEADSVDLELSQSTQYVCVATGYRISEHTDSKGRVHTIRVKIKESSELQSTLESARNEALNRCDLVSDGVCKIKACSEIRALSVE